jgi:AbrB family looped-hinge helix DNA binding protein
MSKSYGILVTAVTISSKGQLVLPKQIREQLKLKAGDRVDLQIEDDERIVLRPLKKSLAGLEGFLPRPEQALSLEEMDETISSVGDIP